MRPRFVIVNVALGALLIAGYAGGLFASVGGIGRTEQILLLGLAALMLFGLTLGYLGRWQAASHIANTLPMWGLAATGLGLLAAVASLHGMTPDALATVFRDLGFSIAPNIAAVLGMVWLKTVAWWAANEEI